MCEVGNMGLSEVKWSDKGKFSFGDYTKFYSCAEKIKKLWQ